MNITHIFFPKQIVLFFSLALALNILRVFIFQSDYYLFMLWNIFLAIIPFVISSLLLGCAYNKKLSKPIIFIGGIIWLLFLPNAPYLVTDMIHLGKSDSAPVIYDTILLFSSALVGLLLMIYSMWHIERIIKLRYSTKETSFLILIIIFLTSFGMYLGRFLRFNSWDLFSNSSFLFKSIGDILFNPTHHKDAYIFTLLAFIFIYASYMALKPNMREKALI